MKAVRGWFLARDAGQRNRSAAPYGIWRGEEVTAPGSARRAGTPKIDVLADFEEALRDFAVDQEWNPAGKEGLLG